VQTSGLPFEQEGRSQPALTLFKLIFPPCISRPLFVDCRHTIYAFFMSGFHSKLSDTLAAARLRATHSGDIIRSMLLLSSSASVGGTSGFRPPGVSFTTLGRQMAGLSTASSSGQGEVEGGSGEFSLWVGGVKRPLYLCFR